MAKRNSSNQDYTNNADGWDLTGGTTPRKLTVSGGDISMVGSGAAVITFPASTATLATLALTETLSNKSFSTALLPSITDGAAIGSTTFQWSDLFLAEGAVINWDNGDVTLTQTNNILAVGGGGTLTFGGADGTAIVDVRVASGAVQGLRIEGAATSDISFSTYVTSDAFLRFNFRPSGEMNWGPGSGSVDTNLYRSAASTLRTDDLMVASLGFQPAANDGAALGVSGTAFADLFLASGAVINFNAGNYTLTHSAGVLTANGALSIGTGNALTAGTIELGAATDTTISRSSAGVIAVEGVVIPSISSTNTLTNKRVTKRTGTTTSSATPTIDTDNVDYYSITAQTVDITSMTTNLSGTPTTGQQLRIDITGTAARAITWGASFANGPVALPTTTVTTTRLYVLLEYDGTIWRCMASGSTV